MKKGTIFQLIAGIFLASSIVACGTKKAKEEPKANNTNTYEKIKSMNWLVGKWQLVNKDTISTETWELKNDSVYSATSMDIKAGKDTLRYEDITIEQKGADVFYIPVMKDQNDGKPVSFKLTSMEGQRMVFENPDHDFPKKISYELKGDSLIAEISGPMEGTEVSMKFPMIRVK